LHNAAINGHRAMIELLLERGADPTIKDAKIGALPAGWAAHAGRTEIAKLLERAANRRV
jgi:ankyrin repeat protein